MARVALVAVWLGSWQMVATQWIDPFISSRPSDIWQQLVRWFTDGTSQGPIWLNIAVTFEEAVVGFLSDRPGVAVHDLVRFGISLSKVATALGGILVELALDELRLRR